MDYDNFIEKLETFSVTPKEIIKFGVDRMKFFTNMLLGICMIIVGAFLAIEHMATFFNFKLMLGAVFVLLGVNLVYHTIKFALVLDVVSKKIVYLNTSVELDNVESVTLRKMLIPKTRKVRVCLDIITKDRFQMVIPISVLNNKLELVGNIRNIIADRFSVEE